MTELEFESRPPLTEAVNRHQYSTWGDTICMWMWIEDCRVHMEGDVNRVYPWVVESWVNFPSVCFSVFSKIFSINMNYFCNWEKSSEYYLKNKK